MKHLRKPVLTIALIGATALLAGPAATQDNTAHVNAEIERFCGNIADAARDRRYLLQAQQLESLKAEIDGRMQQLEAKRAEYEEWMKRRDQFMARASDNVVGIYSKMKPDAAAEQLTTMQADLAAAIMMKLEVKQSGLIMNEMDSEAAAKLAVIMAAAARKEDPS